VKSVIIGLRDKVSNNFEGITMAQSEAVAKRDFAYSVNNSDMLLFKAKDLAIYHIGDIDTESGIITVLSPMIMICSGDEVINDE
jgi:hypothetical protein